MSTCTSKISLFVIIYFSMFNTMLDMAAERESLSGSEEGPETWVEFFNLAVKDVLGVLQNSCVDASWPPLAPSAFAPELPDRWWDISQVRLEGSNSRHLGREREK